VLLVLQESSLDELHSDGVESGHDDLVVLSSAVNDELIDSFGPVLPFLPLDIELIVVAGTLAGELELVVLTHEVSDLNVELGAAFRSRGATDRPNEAEDKDTLKHLLEVFNFFRDNLLELSVEVGHNEAVEETEHRLAQVVVNCEYRLRAVLSGVGNDGL
jgi:hypothetical protein